MTVRSDPATPSPDDIGDAPASDPTQPRGRPKRHLTLICRPWIRAAEPPLTDVHIGDPDTGPMARKAA